MKRWEEKTLSSEIIYKGNFIELHLDQVSLPDGSHSQREIVKHPGAVAVLAWPTEDKMLFVRQYRKALERVSLEIPAGKIDEREDPAECGKRELREETGYIAKDMIPLFSFYSSPGFANEQVHLFRAKNLSQGKQDLQDGEETLEVEELNLVECMKKIDSGEICDAKTIIAIYFWKNIK